MNDHRPDSLLRRIAAGDFDQAAEPPVEEDTLRRYVARASPPGECARVTRLLVTDPRWRERYVALVAGHSAG